MRHLLLLLMSVLVFAPALARAQELPPCGERPTTLANPWVDFDRYCAERVIDAPESGRFGFTALAFMPDGRLFATRPLTGELVSLSDGNGDGLPEQAQVVAGGMTLPNGLTYHNGALYISGGAHLYRWQDGELMTLVEDLPSGAGLWTGGVAVGPDERLYVSTGAPCDLCAPDDPDRGAVLSFALDGSDRQRVAGGLRAPADLTFVNDVLWTVDTASDFQTTPDMDELNIVTPGADFGWPYCVGADGVMLLPGRADCDGVTPPAFSLPTHSTPVGLAYVESATFPALEGKLLVVLQGSNNEAYMQGYALVAVDPAQPDAPYTLVVPSYPDDYRPRFSLQDLNVRTSGVWPQRPFDVAVSPEGWVYLSISDGRIIALRPR